MPRGKHIKEVTYEINAQTEEGRFTIPQDVRIALNMAENEYPPLNIVIRDAQGNYLLGRQDKPLRMNMTSGPEIVNKATRAILESKQHIWVTVSRAD